MRCPFCAHVEDRVVDSRLVRAGRVIRRRRQCEGCAKRFTTYETIDEGTPVIVKKDGRREPYSREKLLGGVVLACQKRPVSTLTIHRGVDEMEARLFEGSAGEVPSAKLGAAVMDFLRETDPIAYLRFASVYSNFNDLQEFLSEIQDMMVIDK